MNNHTIFLATPIVISLFSLCVSLYVAYRAWKFNELSTRRASREAHAKMLVDIGRMFVDTPELWAIYDTHAHAVGRDMSPLGIAKREAVYYQIYNLFELTRDYYVNVITRDRVDEEYWQSWHCYIRQFFLGSSEARVLFLEQRTQEIYSKSFVNYVNKLISEFPPLNQAKDLIS